jgi:uncharacterized protein (TIGR00255 family)
MTGFGQAEGETEKFTVKVEIKSLNNKFFELSIRMPRNWLHKELELRKEMAKLIERGTAQLNIQLTYKLAEDRITPINREVAAYYLNEVKSLANESGLDPKDLLANIFDIPNVLQPNESTPDDADWIKIMEVVKKAFEQFDLYRLTEGKILTQEFSSMALNIATKMNALTPFENERIETVKERLRKELAGLNQDQLDKNRFEQELIYYLEKLDINEEKVRLKQHCDYLEEVIRVASTGKKLGFIAQEMGREINTIGSKSNHHLMQRSVVEMKEELERIKEQINNVL